MKAPYKEQMVLNKSRQLFFCFWLTFTSVEALLLALKSGITSSRFWRPCGMPETELVLVTCKASTLPAVLFL